MASKCDSIIGNLVGVPEQGSALFWAERMTETLWTVPLMRLSID